MKNRICIGVSNEKWIFHLLERLPREKFRNIDQIIFIVDDRQGSEKYYKLLGIINSFDNINLVGIDIIKVTEISKAYQHGLNKTGKNYFFDYGASFKVLAFPFINRYFDESKILLLDDGILILKDPSDLFSSDYSVKRDGLFTMRKGQTYETIREEFQKIFEFEIPDDLLNKYNLNSGSILNSGNWEFIERKALAYLNNSTLFDLFDKNKKSRTGIFWTLEQRFFCFYHFWLSNIQKIDVHLLKNDEVYLVTNSISGRFSKKKKKFPVVTHYALGSKKDGFLEHTLEMLNFYDSNK